MNIHISQTVGSVELNKDVMYQPLLYTLQATCCCCCRRLHHHHHHHHHQISHFSALAGKYSPILGCSKHQDQVRWSYLQIKMFLTVEHVPRITDFCRCMYVFGGQLSLVRFCDSDFGITSVDDITFGINCAYYYYYYYYY